MAIFTQIMEYQYSRAFNCHITRIHSFTDSSFCKFSGIQRGLCSILTYGNRNDISRVEKAIRENTDV